MVSAEEEKKENKYIEIIHIFLGENQYCTWDKRETRGKIMIKKKGKKQCSG